MVSTMNTADLKRATQQAHRATASAQASEKSKDWQIAAGFYRNAAALWRIAEDEEQAERCDYKADEMEGKK